MEGLVEHRYTGIDTQSKVKYPHDGIKTDKFDAVKTCSMSDEQLCSNFNSCITLYKDYTRQTTKSNTSATLNIAEVKVGGKRKHDASVEDCYYTKNEYNKLTAAQKKELASTRVKWGHKPGAKDSMVKGGSKTSSKEGIKDMICNIRAVNCQVSQLAKQMGKTKVNDDGSTSSLTSGSVADERVSLGRSNRTNPALPRQEKATIQEKK